MDDVIFIGGGISTMVAAAELLEAGRQVTIVERTSQLGGQCRDAFGGFFFVDTPEQRRIRVRDSQELAWADWERYAEFGPNSESQQLWARRYIERCVPDVREWLHARGLRFFPTANWAERAYEGRGNRVPRFHLLWGCGSGLVERIGGELKSERLRVLTDTTVDELLVEGGSVVGVRNKDAELRADNVVIASGGITGNIEKVRANWPWGAAPEQLLRGVPPTADGAMHDAAAAAGAQLGDLENLWVYAAGISHWEPEFADHGLAIIPPKSGLWVRADGARFDPPLLAGYDTRDAVERIAQEPHPWTWMVLNEEILDRELAVQGSRFNPAFREHSRLRVADEVLRGNRRLTREVLDRCADIVTADDVPTLAARMTELTPNAPVSAEALERDVAGYDGEISRGSRLYTDPQLVSLRNIRAFIGDRMRTAAFRPIDADRSSPLVAIRLRLVARKSLGGIVTDDACRVTHRDGSVVDGLYAIGEAAGFGGGGMNGKRTLEGTLLGGCVLTGRVLAKELAR